MSDIDSINVCDQAVFCLKVVVLVKILVNWNKSFQNLGWLDLMSYLQYKPGKRYEACSNGFNTNHTGIQESKFKQPSDENIVGQYVSCSNGIEFQLNNESFQEQQVCCLQNIHNKVVIPKDDYCGNEAQVETDPNTNICSNGTFVEAKSPNDSVPVQETTIGSTKTMQKDLCQQFMDSFKLCNSICNNQSEFTEKPDSVYSPNKPYITVLQNPNPEVCHSPTQKDVKKVEQESIISCGTINHVSTLKRLLIFVGKLYMQALTCLVLLGTLKKRQHKGPQPVKKQTCTELVGNIFENPDQLNGGNISEETTTRSHTQDDTKREIYRLSTFRNYPTSRINTALFAKAGFYFIGVADRVQCFACNHVLENLSSNVDPLLLRNHETSCPFIRGPGSAGNVPIGTQATLSGMRQHVSPPPSNPPVLNSGARPNGPIATVRNPMYQTARVVSQSSNVSNGTQQRINNTPIERHLADIPDPAHQRLIQQLDLCKEVDRVRSFTHAWNRDNLPSPRRMANAGWFYLGNLDRTQCFSCGGVLRNWRISDYPSVEHVKHFPQCAMAMGQESRNIPEQEPEQLPQVSVRRLTEQEKIDLRNMFPCADPRTPEMRSVQSRASTYTNWTYTRATPAMLAEAGYFSLGVRDRVKCYYCNGGLQNWRRNDDPWEQHAKWYPTCEFVLQNKGPEYIHSVVARYPDIDRPTPRTRGQDVPPALRQSQNLPILPPPEIVDPQQQMQQERSLLEQALQSEQAYTVIGMGFSEQKVKEVIQSQIENQGVSFATTEALLDAVLIQSNSEDAGISNLSLPIPEVNELHLNPSSDSELDDDVDLYSSNMVMDTGRGVDASDSPIHFMGSNGAHSNLSNGFAQNQRSSEFSQLAAGSSQGHFSFASQTSMTPSGGSMVSAQDNLERQRDELERLRSDRLCKVCLDRNSNMVFIPCGHLCCCLECTRALRTCPVCRKHITRAVRTYTSI
uniref:ZF(RING)-14 zinc finger protein n=1 Tax=Phallusia mammillata TaxID=59560 RepID=A0A6F9D7E9_9ASCI|nr:ZF(RING)-14 zinc finger protein [Phallusia mammillata]